MRDQAVDAGAEVAFALQHGDDVLVLAFPAAHEGGEDDAALAHRFGHDVVDDLLGRLPGDGFAADPAVGDTGPGVEEAEVVVDFGGGGDGGSRVGVALLLLDGDGRGQAGDGLHVRLGGHVEELPGVGGEAFHIAALSLDVDGVEGEAGFSRTGEAGEDGEGVPGEVDGDVFEVVFFGSDDSDELIRHGFSFFDCLPAHNKRYWNFCQFAFSVICRFVRDGLFFGKRLVDENAPKGYSAAGQPVNSGRYGVSSIRYPLPNPFPKDLR